MDTLVSSVKGNTMGVPEESLHRTSDLSSIVPRRGCKTPKGLHPVGPDLRPEVENHQHTGLVQWLTRSDTGVDVFTRLELPNDTPVLSFSHKRGYNK